MEEKLGFPLKELKHSEILPPSYGLASKIRRGYSLDKAGMIIGLRLEYCNVKDIDSLATHLTGLEYLNLANAWPREKPG